MRRQRFLLTNPGNLAPIRLLSKLFDDLTARQGLVDRNKGLSAGLAFAHRDPKEVDMRSVHKFCALITICAAAGAAAQARAGVISPPTKETISGPSLVQQAHYRHWHHYHWRGHHHWAHHWRHGHWAYYPRYRAYGYYPWRNPAGAVAGAAVGLATAPIWALGGWGYPYYWYP
jgi:hypothetical protein